ncbi:MAG: hypothetical protein OXI83_11235, partial [Gemmatimonadota bacterium]|nr:hypothetical protein [Gemmatimonadota bacterium]
GEERGRRGDGRLGRLSRLRCRGLQRWQQRGFALGQTARRFQRQLQTLDFGHVIAKRRQQQRPHGQAARRKQLDTGRDPSHIGALAPAWAREPFFYPRSAWLPCFN